jgi:uncharacterized protein (DUF2235 family)
MKRILICLDGTWNEADDKATPHDTNVIRLFRSAEHFKSPSQQAFYVQGVGSKLFEKLRGGILGYGLFDQVKEAYQAIVNSYQRGDRIIVAGFSRGAFSARCLASFIATCGILRNHAIDIADFRDNRSIEELWDLYAQRSTEPQKLRQFCSENCHPPTQPLVEAVAVWDTVGALGIPWGIFEQNTAVELLSKINARKYNFLDPELPQSIPRAYHAVALDEQRVPFKPTLFAGPRLNSGEILQVWFAGAHSNVGGGFADTGLSNIALDWMVRQLSSNHGLNLQSVQLDPAGVWDPIGQTDMDRKAAKVDQQKLHLLSPRQVPAGALLHPSADRRQRGEPGRSAIPSTARFEGPYAVAAN